MRAGCHKWVWEDEEIFGENIDDEVGSERLIGIDKDIWVFLKWVLIESDKRNWRENKKYSRIGVFDASRYLEHILLIDKN